MEFDYDSLAVHAAVVRTGSFEAAARHLNVTQSAVSQRIKQLEERVGTLLIVRGRPCVPTEDGLLLCQHLEQVSLLEHEMRERLGSIGGADEAIAASIRIAVNADSLATWFPKVIARAADELRLRLEIVPDDQEFTEERLRSGDVLAAVTSSDAAIAGCRRVALGAMEYMAVATPQFAEKYFVGGVTLDTIRGTPSIAFDRKDSLPDQWMLKAFGEVTTPSAHHVPSYEGHLVCCERSIGWAMMPSVTVLPLVQAGDLVELVAGTRVPVDLHWQSRSRSSEMLRLLSEIVEGEAKPLLTQPAMAD